MKKKTVSVIAVAMAFLLLTSLLLSVIGSMGALASGHEAELDAIEQQKEELQAQREEMQAGIDELLAQRDTVLEKKALLDEQNRYAVEEMELIDEQIEVYTGLIEDKAEELADAQEAETSQYELYCKRVRAMEENGSYTYLDILFNCTSLGELLGAMDDISEIMDADRRLYEKYTAAREETERVKAEYEDTLADLGDKQDELEAEKARLEAEIEEATDLINDLEADIEAAQAEYAANEAAEQALNAQMDAIAAQIAAEEEAARQEAAQNGTDYTGPGSTATGSYTWPCPSCTYITSGYGNRIHPIFGTERWHSGIDIGAAAGATVIAADSGTVSVATYSSSYGNYVMIYHSNGTYTLYAHMSSIAVTAGQSVTKGDTIGYVGSTGWSTGPHLHFEIRNSGGTIDPTQFFSGLTYAPDA
ncbi:MAG TPA: peptidoglycan DD-metalloendopeptidase family protein [Candidatus Scatomorpha stercoravium]|nr:peptidoglycan DD-metalloendopeptidase family protein [Candidatus Scatomorpha stercoravium]